jgi:hypothetical protein
MSDGKLNYDTNLIQVFDNGVEKLIPRAEYEAGVAAGKYKPLKKPAVTPPAGYVTVTYQNIGDLLGKTVLLIKRANGAIPTPDQIGVDNTVIGLDGITNYGFVVRESLRLIGYISVADGAGV